MTGRIVEIAEDGRHLSLSRGFLVVAADGRELGRVALDDVAVLLINAHGVTHTTNLLLALAERGAAVVLCGPNHLPAAFLWPVSSHHVQARRMRAQVEAPATLARRLWQAIVRAKIRQQAAALEAQGQPGGALTAMARRVRVGDPDNLEAQAARRYWPLLFGSAFRRDQDGEGANALLNYGYAILRSATARAVAAAGLHPSIGLHHANRGNPLCLVDDLMEPFRPFVDLAVLRLAAAGHAAVTRDAKRYLALLPSWDMATAEGTTPIATVVVRMAGSLARVLEDGAGDLDLPALVNAWAPTPLEWPAPPQADTPAC